MSFASSPDAKVSPKDTPAWLKVFGVQRDPFENNLRVFFPGGQRQENLDALRHLAHYSQRILLVTGNKGSGKTFLLEKLCACEKDVLKLAPIKAKLLQGSNSLLQTMAAAIDLSVSSKITNTELMDKIHTACKNRFANGFKTLFIIDDAEDLSEDSLDLLVSFFRPETQPVCGLLLLAKVQIIEQIKKISARSSVQPFHQIQLKTFTQAETVAYVEHYLMSVGWNQSVPLSPVMCAKLHALGQGLPGRINRTAATVLQSETLSSRRSSRAPSRKQVVFIGGILGATCLLTVIMVSFYALFGDDESRKAEKQTITLAIPEDPINQDETAPEMTALTDESLVEDKIKEISEEKKAALAKQMGPKEREKENMADLPSDTDRQNPVATQNPVVRQAPVAPPKTVVPPKTVESPRKAAANQKATESVSVAPPVAASVDTLSVAENKAPKLKKVLPAQQNPYLRTQDWIDGQVEGGWTIQVLGVLNENSAIAFFSDESLTEDYFYVKSSYRGKDWYVVLHGIYPNKQAAKDGLGKLPVKLRSAGAWYRSLAGLKSR